MKKDNTPKNSSKKNNKKKGNKQNWAMSLAAGLMCAVVFIYFAVPGLKDMITSGKKDRMTVAELVQELQSDLPTKATGELCTITQTGLEVRKDTLAYIYTFDIKNKFEKQYQIEYFKKVFYGNGLDSIVDEYGKYRLTTKACDAGMVFTFEYYDTDGSLISKSNFTPEVYRPLL